MIGAYLVITDKTKTLQTLSISTSLVNAHIGKQHGRFNIE
jgi:hypothetical protein